MAESILQPPGDLVGPADLTVSKARDLVRLLESGILPFVGFVEARCAPDFDVVVFDIEPEVPQSPVVDIRRVERIAVVFYKSDDIMPETISLRTDFPRKIAHLNLRSADAPWASFCLYEERYADLKLRWTAAAYIRRVHEWLSKTAQGTLHQHDQPVEPFLMPSAIPLVVPSDFLAEDSDDEAIAIYRVGDKSRFVLVARHGKSADHGNFFAVRVLTPPQVHGAINQQPKTLAELHSLLGRGGMDLADLLRKRFADIMERRSLLEKRLVLIIGVPLRRTALSPVEASNVFAFATAQTIREVGKALDIWDLHEGTAARILAPDKTHCGETIMIDTLRPVYGLSREAAALISGEKAATPHIVCVGVGMLGSQVVANLARSGYGDWTIVDHDHVLPHNLVRHQLNGDSLGIQKACALITLINGLFDNTELAHAIEEDVLKSADHKPLQVAFDKADLILDMSASATVARHLAIDVTSSARRLSLFLNPDGTDLVLLSEALDRGIRLDDLEMQYYREIWRSTELRDHLRPSGKGIRYGQSCRDVTVAIPQHRAAIASGIGAAAVKKNAAEKEAKIYLWRMQSDLSVRALSIEAKKTFQKTVGDWVVRWDDEIIRRVRELRAVALPNETGGILVGHHDMERKIVYFVDALPAPPDSEGRPFFFKRGCADLQRQVQDLEISTAAALTYVGEWHSHPDGHPTALSKDDKQVLNWLKKHLDLDGLPAAMLIVSDSDFAIHVEDV